jgi:hypothetical protein
LAFDTRADGATAAARSGSMTSDFARDAGFVETDFA